MNWLLKLITHKIDIKDPTPSSMVKKTFKIAWPSATEAFLISIIGAVDMMMVGRLGESAIAAVGITNQPKFILLSMLFALNVGTTVVISRRRGEKNHQALKDVMRHSLIIAFIMSLVFAIIGIVFAKELVLIAGASSDYLQTSIDYLRVIMIGNFFLGMSMNINAAQRGVGNTLIAMKTNLTANVVNVILNFLLINGIWIFPRLEVVGAGIATTIGNFVMFVIAFRSILDKESLLYQSFKDSFKYSKEIVASFVKLGKPALTEQIFIRIGFLLYARAVADLGTTAFATHQLVMNVMVISFAIGDGLSTANSALIGQSLGAKRPDVAMGYGKITQRIGLTAAILFSTLLALNRESVLSLFTNDQTIIDLGAPLIVILSVIILFQIVQVIVVGALRGAGDVKFVATLSLVSVSIVRPALTYVFAYGLGFGLTGAWMSVLVDQIMRFVISQVRFNSATWTKIKV
ncbi:MAG: MATE family efflux transporter [Erysipelotrichaceae bacterium]|nr:MATE family efflux transporter [Erysipelotrichaceae bacterium]